MSPLSGPVLTGATIVASPALWAGLVDQTMPLNVALTRYLIAVVICWALFSVVAEFTLPSPGSTRPKPGQHEPAPVEALADDPADDPR